MAGKTRETACENANGEIDAAEAQARHRARPCPICKAPSAYDYRPFCSRRCADVDLSRWLSGHYAIPGGDADEDEDGDLARTEDLMRSEPRDDI
ncbi:MAG: DNA gyrase inhibitor YacG [Alphaproteobacteria bacterium]|nr:DNA gyrase inhibitor YacG [Alphaproteobacteria bacterium]